jgi:hypothetical protein
VGQRDLTIFDAHEMPQVPHRFHDQVAGLVTVHASELAGVLVECAVGVQNVDHRQLVPLTAGVVVRVVGRCHLHRTGPHLDLREDRVGDDGNLAAVERDANLLPHQVAIAVV